MNDELYRDLLDWWMVSDPWPTVLGREHQNRVTAALDEEAAQRGFPSAVVAFHDFQPRETGK